MKSVIQRLFPWPARVYRDLRDHLRFLRDRRIKYSFIYSQNQIRFRGLTLLRQFQGRDKAGELSAVVSILSTRDIDVFVDIGANQGLFTLLALCCSSVDRVVSLEPCNRNYSLLLSNLTLQDPLVSARAMALHMAVGDHCCVSSLFGGLEGGSMLQGWGGIVSTYSEAVQVCSLDRLSGLWGNQKKSLVKVDVEGLELEVLRGGIELIRYGLALFIVECSLYENKICASYDDYVDIFDLMFKEGMRAYTLPGLFEVDRAVVDVWIKRGSGLPGAVVSTHGAVPERTLNILFAPARGMM